METGEFLRSAADVEDLVVGVHQGKPVYLREVAKVEAGAAQPARYVWYTPGAGAATAVERQAADAAPGAVYPAVTLTVTKKPGENAVDVARAARQRVDELRNTIIPAGIDATITRDYGATAAEKANKLIQKLGFATASVILLVGLALGKREAVIVGAAVILTLTATLFASWAWGFTLNRVSLFALIFSIGILVDDAIVVVENIHRHQLLDPTRRAQGHHSRGGGRSRRPHHPGHAHGDRGAAADGLRQRPDGAVHEPDPHQQQPGHGAVAGHRLHRHALAGAEADEAARHAGRPPHGALRPAASPPAMSRLFAGLLTPFLESARKRWLLLAGILVALVLSVRHWPPCSGWC